MEFGHESVLQRLFTFQAVPGDDAAIISAAPINLTQIGGYNDSAALMYIQLFNRITLPPAATPPIMSFFVPIGGTFSWDPSRDGRLFTLGLVYAVSSTRDTYTALVTPIFLYAEGYIS